MAARILVVDDGPMSVQDEPQRRDPSLTPVRAPHDWGSQPARGRGAHRPPHRLWQRRDQPLHCPEQRAGKRQAHKMADELAHRRRAEDAALLYAFGHRREERHAQPQTQRVCANPGPEHASPPVPAVCSDALVSARCVIVVLVWSSADMVMLLMLCYWLFACASRSGLPVFFTSDTPLVCTVNGSTVTLTATGICGVLASQDGDAHYVAAPDVLREFSVSSPVKQSQTISFAPLNDRIVGEAPFAIGASASSGLPVSFASSTLAVCSVGGGQVALVHEGICTITASQGGNASYNPTPAVARSFVVSNPAKQAQTISFAPLPDHALADAPFTLAATASSGLAVSFTSDTPAMCGVGAATVTRARASARSARSRRATPPTTCGAALAVGRWRPCDT